MQAQTLRSAGGDMSAKNQSVLDTIVANNAIYKGARRAHFAAIIRGKMLEKGLRNVDIAQRIGVSEPNVSRWLRGTQNLSIDTLYLLADAIEERLSLILGDEQKAISQGNDHSDLCMDEIEWVSDVERPSCQNKNVSDLHAYRCKKRKVAFDANKGDPSDGSTWCVAPSEDGYEYA